MKIYISGKITGLPYAEAWQQFEAVEKQLQAHGFEVINPMRVVKDHKNASWKEYMKMVIPLVFDCDCIYLLNTWVRSNGAKIERHLALDLDLVLLTEHTLPPHQVKDYIQALMKAKYTGLINDN